MINLKLVSAIEKRAWAPWQYRLRRRLMRLAGYALRALSALSWEWLKLRLQPALALVTNTVVNLPGGGGPAIQAEQKFLHLVATGVLSGNYPGKPGDTLDVTTIVLPPGYTLPSLGAIIMGWAQSIQATGPSGFTYTVVPGTTARNGTLDVQQGGGAGNPNAEISTAAYPATVTADLVQIELLISIAG